jgi:hypothetical protein
VEQSAVEKQIAEARAQAAAEARILAKHPDLSNQESELFKAAVEELERVRAMDPVEIAAELAQMRLQKQQAPPAAPNGPTRQERAAFAGAPSAQAPVTNPENEELDPEQRRLLKIFQDQGLKITEEQYKARLKNGIFVSRKGGR